MTAGTACDDRIARDLDIAFHEVGICHGTEVGEQDREQMRNLFID